VRSEPLDPRYADFFKANPKRQFELVVQGKFKKVNSGRLFLGAEIYGKLKMGVFSKCVCKIILKIISTITGNLHYSFGSKTEIPHIAFPLAPIADKIIITPPGQPLPPINDVWKTAASFPRKKGNPDLKFQPRNTYSVSFHSPNVSILDWKAVNVPGVKDISLKHFFQDLPMNWIAYEQLPAKPGQKANSHSQERKRYFFNVRFTQPAGATSPKAWERKHAPNNDSSTAAVANGGGGDNSDSNSDATPSATAAAAAAGKSNLFQKHAGR
jgi:hypothetical protein